MARPQLEDGHTDFANEIAEALARTYFSPSESKVFWAVARKTWGWHKKRERISYSQFEGLTHMSRRHIADALNRLINRKIINRTGNGYKLEYGIQKDYEQWILVPPSVTNRLNKSKSVPLEATKTQSVPPYVTNRLRKSKSVPPSVTKKSLLMGGTNLLPMGVNTKENKETISNIYINNNILPNWINKENWEAFLEMRKKKGATPTERAKELLIKKLETLKEQGNDPNEVLNQSTMSNWTGLFPLRGEQSGTHRQGIRQLPQRYTPPEDI